jgi:hypothetical protein
MRTKSELYQNCSSKKQLGRKWGSNASKGEAGMSDRRRSQASQSINERAGKLKLRAELLEIDMYVS